MHQNVRRLFASIRFVAIVLASEVVAICINSKVDVNYRLEDDARTSLIAKVAVVSTTSVCRVIWRLIVRVISVSIVLFVATIIAIKELWAIVVSKVLYFVKIKTKQ